MSRKKTGQAPGSVIYTGKEVKEEVTIHLVQFDEENIEQESFTTAKSKFKVKNTENQITWYDIRGIHNTKIVEHLGTFFNIHSMVLEDIVNINQRAKYEEFEDGIFITLKALSFDKKKIRVTTEQISIYIKDNQIISFQEKETDLFETVRKRLDIKESKVRTHKSDFLAYCLIDCVVDNYFDLLDSLEEVIEKLERKLIESESTEHKTVIHQLKKEILKVRKLISPLRELVGKFSKSDSPLINKTTEVYIRDLQDHTIQLIDITETYRDVLNGLYDLLTSNVSMKMNRIMQVLTIISTIFIPLTFLAGIYGMNFDNIPELHWKYGYYAFWGMITMITISLVFFFKKKKWF